MATPTPPPYTSPFTITIIGGGIGGLVLAAGLLRRSIPVLIYEAKSSFHEIGLGLSIGPAAHRCMPLIDPAIREIYDSLITTHADSPGYEAFRETWFEIVWAGGSFESGDGNGNGKGSRRGKDGEVLMDLKASPSGQTTVRRADFLDALMRLIPADCVHFGRRLERLEETPNGVKLGFEDGSKVMADIVIGCDGIRSVVKHFMLPEESESCKPTYSGMYGYRAVLDMETMVEAVGGRRARVSTMYVGKGAYGISYPIMRAKKVNVGLYVLSEKWDGESWVRPTTKEEMLEDLEHMGKGVNSLMNNMPDPSQWAIFEQPHISTFTRSRIAILGDAAHASTPHQGAGAGQAIEDAHVLSELLADPHITTSKHVVAALKAYDVVRRPRSQRVVTSSKENAKLLCLCFDGVVDDGDKLRETWSERYKWLWGIDVKEQVEEARRVMVGLLDGVLEMGE